MAPKPDRNPKTTTIIKMGSTGFTLTDDEGNLYDLNQCDPSVVRDAGRELSKVRGFKLRYVPPPPPIPLDPEAMKLPLPARKKGKTATRRRSPQ